MLLAIKFDVRLHNFLFILKSQQKARADLAKERIDDNFRKLELYIALAIRNSKNKVYEVLVLESNISN